MLRSLPPRGLRAGPRRHRPPSLVHRLEDRAALCHWDDATTPPRSPAPAQGAPAPAAGGRAHRLGVAGDHDAHHHRHQRQVGARRLALAEEQQRQQRGEGGGGGPDGLVEADCGGVGRRGSSQGLARTTRRHTAGWRAGCQLRSASATAAAKRHTLTACPPAHLGCIAATHCPARLRVVGGGVSGVGTAGSGRQVRAQRLARPAPFKSPSTARANSSSQPRGSPTNQQPHKPAAPHQLPHHQRPHSQPPHW